MARRYAMSETIVVTPDLQIMSKYGRDIEHVELIGRYERDEGEELMLARYWPGLNELWFTWPNMTRDINAGGKFADQFNAMYNYLAQKYPQFGPRTKVNFGIGIGESELLGDVLYNSDVNPSLPSSHRPSEVESHYPSGTPIYFGDRRPVRVREHRRRSA